MRRRDFLKLAGGAAAAGLVGWPAPEVAGRGLGPFRPGGGGADGPVAHVLPTVSHDRILLKVSFHAPQPVPPWLRVDVRRAVPAIPGGGEGRFWTFLVDRLAPGRRHLLELWSRGRRALGPWTLATFPAPGQRVSRFRVLVYTCAGGDDFFGIYVPMETRRRLLRRALDFEPDAVIANGDHVYWDREVGGLAFFTRVATAAFGFGMGFDPNAPVLGHPGNERFLAFIGDRQIAALYGTLFRSVPVFFLRDDHDYFEDDLEEDFRFPPTPFMRALARATQWLYYPELLETASRRPLPGAGAADRPAHLSEAFGVLRYGRLAELLLYDCKGFMTRDGAAAGQVPPAVEAWLLERTARSGADHLVHVPSNPFGWSAGKPAEWYPDVVEAGGLGEGRPKAGWQSGFLAQHDRLLAAASARPGIPLFVSGDIHSIAEARIVRSGALDLSDNPVVSLIAGTPGTGPRGWPSAVRQVLAAPPGAIESESVVPVEERNGFHLIDFTPDSVTIRHFHWIPGASSPALADPERLEPFHVSRYVTRARRRTLSARRS